LKGVTKSSWPNLTVTPDNENNEKYFHGKSSVAISMRIKKWLLQMPGGVGGFLSDGESYPDSAIIAD
jgi:hypothetical protein